MVIRKMAKEKTKIKQFAIRSMNIDGIDEANREINVTFMTETICDIGWWTPERCICEEGCVVLTRFDNGVMPALFNHHRDVIIGKVKSVTIENHVIRATISFDEDEEAEKVWKKVAGDTKF